MRILALEALTTFDLAIVMIERVDGMPEGPDKARMLSELTASLKLFRPTLRDVLRTQEQAAQALNLPQGKVPRLVCGAFRDVPNPYPDAANPHASPPQQPSPSVA